MPFNPARLKLRKLDSSGVIVLLICSVSLVLFSSQGCKKSEAPPEVVVSVTAEKPVTGSISEQIRGDAILAPLAQAALSPKISAPVKKFYVQRGSHVRAGQLLVALEDRDLAATALDTN
jgi:HlyD family secretion protein